MSGQCKYCGAVIPIECIRCQVCDVAWQDGWECGVEETKDEIREIVSTIMNLVCTEREEKKARG